MTAPARVAFTIHIASDHAGIDLIRSLQDHLNRQGHEVHTHGPSDFDPDDDYPAFCIDAARAVARDQSRGVTSLGVVIGGSGNGEQIAANKVPGIRAALIWNSETAELARSHNDANIAAIGARQHSIGECLALIDRFLETPFSHEQRHERRVHQIAAYERARGIVYA